jgi:hypothetical protein
MKLHVCNWNTFHEAEPSFLLSAPVNSDNQLQQQVLSLLY